MLARQSSRRSAPGRWGTAAPVAPARVLLSALALATVAGACSGAERPTLIDQAEGVDTEAVGSAGRPSGGGGSDDGGGSDSPSSSVPPTSAPAPSTTAEAGTVPEVTSPAPAGVGAVVSPRGILVRVTGEVEDGYVVETPCGLPAVIPWGQPVGPVQVVIDPGHGGDEAGAVADSGLTEAELNLNLARRAAAELTRRSVTVVLTRNGDYRIPISRRAALADAVAPAAFVSIHHNTPASAPSTTPGTEVFVQSTSEPSRRLGGLVYESVVAELSRFDVEWTARTDAGVLTVLDDDGVDAYGIARYPTTPSALVEMAYLGNPREAALLATDDYLEAAASALADGIERFLTSDDPGSGFVDTPRTFNPQTETGGTDGCLDPEL